MPQNRFHRMEECLQQHETEIAAMAMANRHSAAANTQAMDKMKAELQQVAATVMHLAKASASSQSSEGMASSSTNHS